MRLVHVITLVAGCAFSAMLSGQVPAAPQQSLQLVRAPETLEELWDAVKFSLNVGQPEQAVEYLDRFLAGEPSAALLIAIRDQDAVRYFPKLSATPELREKGMLLIRKADEAARQRATDPARIRKFIGYLPRSPQHWDYGLAQLRLAGADAVPYLISALRDPSFVEHHAKLVYSVQLLDRAAVPPLVAALLTEDLDLLGDLIEVLSVLRTRDAVPHLRYVAEQSEVPPNLRAAARAAVKGIMGRPYAALPAAPEALVEQARRYYDHEVALSVSSHTDTVRLWRWVPREGLHAEEVSPSYAEEYFGTLHCQQALALQPNYEPAQLLMLSLALEKEAERVGIDQELPGGPGRVSAEALAAGPELMSKALARALQDGHPVVVLGAIRALGQMGDRSLLATRSGKPSPIVQALSVSDPRIQFAAAEAVLSMNPQRPFPGAGLVVPILTRVLVTQESARAVVIDPDTVRGSRLAALLRAAGYETSFVASVREGFAMAAKAPDCQLIFIDPNVHSPTISFALAAFRSDPRTAGIPIVVPGSLAMQRQLSKFERRYSRVKFFLRPTQLETLKLQVEPLLAELESEPLTAEERAEFGQRAARWLVRLSRGEIRGIDPSRAEPALLDVLSDQTLGPDAIVAISYFPTAASQNALAELVGNDAADMLPRVAAARGLARSLQRFGVKLDRRRIPELWRLSHQSSEPVLHQALAALVGGLRPAPAAVGSRLRRFAVPPYERAGDGAGARPPKGPGGAEAPIVTPQAEPTGAPSP